jgi:four helix bundle protein
MGTSRFRKWLAYQKAMRLADSIYRMTATFPSEERFSLIDQMRRSSRSVCANLAETYGRRKYAKYYKSKLSDCITENFETQVWLDIALSNHYIAEDQYNRYIQASEEVGKLLTYMQNNYTQFATK